MCESLHFIVFYELFIHQTVRQIQSCLTVAVLIFSLNFRKQPYGN